MCVLDIQAQVVKEMKDGWDHWINFFTPCLLFLQTYVLRRHCTSQFKTWFNLKKNKNIKFLSNWLKKLASQLLFKNNKMLKYVLMGHPSNNIHGNIAICGGNNFYVKALNHKFI
jgi:hypothetical protein